MNRSYAARLLATATAIASVVYFAGCDSKPKEHKLADADVVGTWKEDPPAPGSTEASPRVARTPRLDARLRVISFAADGSFKMMLADSAGKADPSKTIHGKWSRAGEIIKFEATTNELGSKFDVWKPQSGNLTWPDRMSPPKTLALYDQDSQGASFQKQ